MNREYHIKDNAIDNAVNVINEMITWQNENAPKIAKLLDGESIGVSTKRPPKKVYDQTQDIIKSAPCRVYLDCEFAYSVYLKVNCHYASNPGGKVVGCSYANNSVYLGAVNDGEISIKKYEPQTLLTPEGVRADLIAYDNACDAVQAAEKIKNEISHKLSLVER